MLSRRCLAGWIGLLPWAACTGFGPPQPATLARLQPMPLARLVPGQCELELESPALSGTFDALVAIVDGAPRLQLFPDVGGKVLDVEILADGVRAELPGSSYRATAPLAAAEPHLALVLAVVVAELLAPVTAARVLGERVDGGGERELELAPALGSGRVRVVLGGDGAIQSYRCELGWLDFTFDADGALRGRGFRGWLRPLGS